MKTLKSGQLSALILTYNEEANIGRVLSKLTWLEKVIVLDSYSSDATVGLVRQFPNTELHFRKFDSHAAQWNHGLSLVSSEWVLTLDADYVLPSSFVSETIDFIATGSDRVAYLTHFKFLVMGSPLMADNTTPRPVLFRKSLGQYFDDGHTQRLQISGETGFYRSAILHDDRKPLSRWLSNQDKYSIKECNKLLEVQESASVINRIRKTKVLAPIFIFFYCLFFKGLILNGWAGWYYTLQRTMVEMLFALRMIEREKLSKG